jgi:HIT domain
MDDELVYDDGTHIAFLSRYPTMRGYTLVVPRRHVEDLSVTSRKTSTLRCRLLSTRSPVRSMRSFQLNERIFYRWAACKATHTFTGISLRSLPAFPTSSSSTTP